MSHSGPSCRSSLFSVQIAVKLVIFIAIMVHIRHQALRIGEGWRHLILPTWFFWWLVYPLWLFLWPGMYRPGRIGKDPAEYLAIARAKKRRGRL